MTEGTQELHRKHLLLCDHLLTMMSVDERQGSDDQNSGHPNQPQAYLQQPPTSLRGGKKNVMATGIRDSLITATKRGRSFTNVGLLRCCNRRLIVDTL